LTINVYKGPPKPRRAREGGLDCKATATAKEGSGPKVDRNDSLGEEDWKFPLATTESSGLCPNHMS